MVDFSNIIGGGKKALKGLFDASTPPPSIHDMRSRPSTKANATDANGKTIGETKTGGSINPWMVWIHGKDATMAGEAGTLGGDGQISIDGILMGDFEVPIAAQWLPVLPQYAGDLVHTAASGIAATAGKVASLTAGARGGGIAAGAAGITSLGTKLLGEVGNLNETSQNLTGESITNPSWYQLIWQGNIPVKFTLPLVFITLEDPEKDVFNPVALLQKFILPSFKNGSLRTPGYHPFDGWNGVGQALTTGGKQGINTLSDVYQLDVHVGNSVRFRNVVIEQVNARYDTTPSVVKGKFHRVYCDVSFLTQQVLVKEDIDSIYKRHVNRNNPADPLQSTEKQFRDLRQRASSEFTSAVNGAANSVRGAISGAGNFLKDVTHIGGL